MCKYFLCNDLDVTFATNILASAEFMHNTHQIISASRLDPDGLLPSYTTNKDNYKDIEAFNDLDRMYMEAMMEDFESSVGR